MLIALVRIVLVVARGPWQGVDKRERINDRMNDGL